MCMTSTHRAVAAGVGIALAAVAPVPAPVKVAMFTVCWHAGSWPDYDTPGSTPSRELGPLSAFISAVVQFVAFLVQAATGDSVARSGVHRGWTHCVESCALAGAGIGYVCTLAMPMEYGVWIGLAAFSGAFSHVVLGDIFTPSGVPLSLLWNLCTPGPNWRRHHIPVGMTTDQPSEHLVFMGAVRIAIVATMVAVTVPVTTHLLFGAVVVGVVWHYLAVSGSMRKVLK